jgi:hypothetical protein
VKIDKRPELGPLAVGDEMVVREGGTKRYYRARVAKVARIWIELEGCDGEHLPWYLSRFRRDDQTTGKTAGYVNEFYTPEQRAWDLRRAAAETYLQEINVEVWQSRRWKNDIVTLANLIREHEGLDRI